MNDKQFYNTEYEQVVLGVMLLDNTLIDIIAGRLTPDCFYNSKNKFIYENICKLWNEKKCANILTLASALSSMNAADLASLTDKVPSSSTWEFYVTELLNLYTARRMRVELSGLLNTMNGQNTPEIIESFNAKIANYMTIGGNQCENSKGLIFRISEQMQDAYNKKISLLGYDCGYDNLNDLTEGFQQKQLYVIGARPSIGKTAFGMGLIANFCKKGVPCSVFSLEMNADQLFYRMTSAEAKVQSWLLRKGLCLGSRDTMARVQRAFSTIYEWPLNIFDTDIDNDNVLYSKIRYEAKINGSKVILIDHLGLIEPHDPSGQRYLDVGKMTKTLHKMCKELDVCIILLCQCGREAEGKEPNLSLLRESGNIEQDADVIMFLHRERDSNEANIPTKVIVAKNRDGRTGTAKFIFQPDFARFREDKDLANKDQYPDLTDGRAKQYQLDNESQAV